MRKRFFPNKCLLIAISGLACVVAAEGQPENERNAVTFAFSLENDVFSGTDREYTNGAKLSWDFAEAATYDEIERLPSWARYLAKRAPMSRRDSFSYGATISLGQNIYTPEDKEATELVVDDRPYAGWTYMGLALRQSKGRTVDTLELTLGLVGPDSYAEEVQNWVHEKIGSAEAKGWDNQLKNEFGGILAWRRDSELISLPDSTDGWGADVNYSYGFAVGNIQTYAQAGANLRFGYNRSLPAMPPRIRPANTAAFPSSEADPRLDAGKKGSGFFVTIGMEGRYVAQNIFIEGNTWADSHGLEEQEWVSDCYAGATLVSGNWSLSYVYTVRSEEYVGQEEPHEFGGITIARSF